VRSERRAWLILWVAFATFCALVFAVVKFSVDYVATAEIDQGARIVATRGQVVFGLPGSADRTLLGSRSELGVGTLLALDRTAASQAELQLFDESRLKLLGGATVELTRMEVGRFVNRHSLVLTQTSGPIRYATRGPIDVVVPNGLVQLTAHGDYTVWIDGQVTRVLVYGGEARVTAGGSSVSVAEGRRAEIDAQRRVQASDRQMTLLLNSDFAVQDQNWQSHDKSNSPQDVNGKRSFVPAPAEVGIEGNALRVVRESIKREHGETGLVQKLDRDVSGFRHLWLRAWVRIDTADLSAGGHLGSEYPMMLFLGYEGSGPWVVGFYYANPDNRPVPTGVQYPQGEWKKYEVDLMNTEASAPNRLLDFAVMGQGHSFDARIAGISLVGE
jgi:hypothetical protein